MFVYFYRTKTFRKPPRPVQHRRLRVFSPGRLRVAYFSENRVQLQKIGQNDLRFTFIPRAHLVHGAPRNAS